MLDSGTNYEVLYFAPVSPGGTHDSFYVGIKSSTTGPFTITVSAPENVCDTDNGYGNAWADAYSIPYFHPENLGTLNTGSTLTYSGDLVDCETFTLGSYLIDKRDFDLISFTASISGTVHATLTTTGGWEATLDILHYNAGLFYWTWLEYLEGAPVNISFSVSAGDEYAFSVYVSSQTGCPAQTPPLGYHLLFYYE